LDKLDIDTGKPFVTACQDTIDVLGKRMYDLLSELFPICRSITGDGVRESYDIIERVISLCRTEVATGTKAFDWAVPKEWNVREAYVIGPEGDRVIDFANNNLHLLGYCKPIVETMSLSKLKEHLYTLEDQPDVVPYRTSYYDENWGFCLAHSQYASLIEGDYKVVVDATLEDGSMTYAETLIEGRLDEEVLITCYTCHPSMCNDSLSGVVVATYLADYLRQFDLKYSYRILFAPETIGSITWLSRNEARTDSILCGLVVTCCGDSGKLTYKRSRRGDTVIDVAAEHVLRHSCKDYLIEDFFPYGSDERQFCSPGFNMAVGSLMRTRYGAYKEYHSSGDDLSFVNAESLGDTIQKYIEIIDILEHNTTYVTTNPKCEPQLGKRGLYSKIGPTNPQSELIMLWLLNLCDGESSLLDIAEKAGSPFSSVRRVADNLVKHGLLVKDDLE